MSTQTALPFPAVGLTPEYGTTDTITGSEAYSMALGRICFHWSFHTLMEPGETVGDFTNHLSGLLGWFPQNLKRISGSLGALFGWTYLPKNADEDGYRKWRYNSTKNIKEVVKTLANRKTIISAECEWLWYMLDLHNEKDCMLGDIKRRFTVEDRVGFDGDGLDTMISRKPDQFLADEFFQYILMANLDWTKMLDNMFGINTPNLVSEEMIDRYYIALERYQCMEKEYFGR